MASPPTPASSASSSPRSSSGPMVSSTAEPVISVRGLRRVYEDVVAVEGLDLDIERGEIFALLGPNGAGKTTAVEILEGYRTRDLGTTILLTTHYLDEAEALADRVGVIAGGRLVEVGTPATIGGRAHAPAQISFVGPTGAETIHTDSPTAAVAELAMRFGGEVPHLTVTRPTLEDVYLDMIGAHR